MDKKSECKREMTCEEKREMTCEEYCPDLNTDNCPYLQEVLESLAKYEDLEERGKLPKLPCVVGDTVYYADDEYYFAVLPIKVYEICIMKPNVFLYKCLLVDGNGEPEQYFEFDIEDFGKTVFLTKPEAEQALKEMEGTT